MDGQVVLNIVGILIVVGLVIEFGHIIVGIVAIGAVIYIFKHPSFLIWGIPAILAGIALHLGVREFKKHKAKQRIAAAKKPDIITADTYRYEAGLIKNRFANRESLPPDEQIKAAGDMGEIRVLQMMESIGGMIVYWGVGLRRGGGSEYDILAISEFGLLHVEVKNYSGLYTSAEGEPEFNPNKWQRETPGGGTQIIKSPFYQAAKAHDNLAEALTEVLGVDVPLYSVIFFENTSFSMRGIQDYRVSFCLSGDMKRYLNSFAHGGRVGTPRVSGELMARLVSYLDNAGHSPVFFDNDLFTQGNQEVAYGV